MKQVRIEKVANGYIVNAGREDYDRVVRVDSDLRVFESFGSMMGWLASHFEIDPVDDLTVGSPVHLGNDET